MSIFRKIIQHFVLKTERFSSLRLLYSYCYIAYAQLIVRVLSRHGCIESIYLRGGRKGEIGQAGLSDIDVLVLNKKCDAESDFVYAKALARSYRQLARYCPLFKDCYSAPVRRALLFRQMKFYETGQSYHRGFYNAYGIPHLENFKEWYLQPKHWIELSFETYKKFGKRLISAHKSDALRYPVKQLDRALEYLSRGLDQEGIKEATELRNYLKPLFAAKINNRPQVGSFLSIWAGYLSLLEYGFESLETPQSTSNSSSYRLTNNCDPEYNLPLPIEKILRLLQENSLSSNFAYYNYNHEENRWVPTLVLSGAKNILNLFSDQTGEAPTLILSNPVIITQRLLSLSLEKSVFMHKYLEPLFLRRYGSFGTNMAKLDLPSEDLALKQITAFDPWQRLHHLLIDRPFGINLFESMLYDLTYRKGQTLNSILSIAFGTLARQRLLLEQKLVTTTFYESASEYLTIYGHELFSQPLRELVEGQYLKNGGGKLATWVENNIRKIHYYLLNIESILEDLTARELGSLEELQNVNEQRRSNGTA